MNSSFKVVFFALLLCSCVSFEPKNLQNEIWDAKRREFISFEGLLARLNRADFLIVGEVHDNPTHHMRQAQIIREMHKDHRNISVVMEHVDSSQEDILKDFAVTKNIEDLPKRLRWVESGWPDWQIFRPIFVTTNDLGISVHHGLFSKNKIMKIYQNGLTEVFEPGEYRRLNLDHFPRTLREQHLEQLYSDHCKLMPKTRLEKMIDIQIARDAYMSIQLTRHGRKAILLTGNGHVSHERGVGFFLQDKNVLNVAQYEIEDGEKFDFKSVKGIDYIWFSSPHARPDPCDGLRRHLHQKNRPASAGA